MHLYENVFEATSEYKKVGLTTKLLNSLMYHEKSVILASRKKMIALKC